MTSTRQTIDLNLDNIELSSTINTVNLNFSGNLLSTAVAGADIVRGNVLSQDLNNDRWVVPSFTVSPSDSLRILGVAANDANQGDICQMIVGGEFDVLVSGAVNRAAFLGISPSDNGVAIEVFDTVGNFGICMVTDSDVDTRLVSARFKVAESN